MNYKHVLLVLMLLVSSFTPVQGVYADEGQDDHETEIEIEAGQEPLKAEIRTKIEDGRYREEFRQKIGDQEFRTKQEYRTGDGMMIMGQAAMPIPAAIQFHHVSPMELIISAMFQQADNLNPEEYMQYCDNPEEMVDKAIEALKAEGVWNDKSVCEKLETEAAECTERTDRCDQILTHIPTFGPDSDVSCDNLTEEKVYENCIARHTFATGASAEMQARCEAQWEAKAATCETMAVSCDADVLRADLTAEAELKCAPLITTTQVTKEDGTTETVEDKTEYNNCIASFGIESRVAAKEAQCATKQARYDEICSKDAFLARCAGIAADVEARIKVQAETVCTQQAKNMFESLSHVCENRDRQYAHCKELTAKHCSFFETAAQRCQEITDEELRTAMIEQASRMCKFKALESGEIEIEFEGSNYGQIVKGLRAARMAAGLSGQAALDEQTENVVDVAEKVNEIEDKGVGYKLKWLLGAAAKSEKEDSEQLKLQAERLDATIASLEAVVETLTDATARAAIEAQIEVLRGQQADIAALAEKKQKRSRGMFSFLFGGDETDTSAEAETETQ